MKNFDKNLPVEILESKDLSQPKKTLSRKIKKDKEIFKEVLEKDNVKNINKIKKSKDKIIISSSWVEKF